MSNSKLLRDDKQSSCSFILRLSKYYVFTRTRSTLQRFPPRYRIFPCLGTPQSFFGRLAAEVSWHLHLPADTDNDRSRLYRPVSAVYRPAGDAHLFPRGSHHCSGDCCAIVEDMALHTLVGRHEKTAAIDVLLSLPSTVLSMLRSE